MYSIKLKTLALKTIVILTKEGPETARKQLQFSSFARDDKGGEGTEANSNQTQLSRFAKPFVIPTKEGTEAIYLSNFSSLALLEMTKDLEGT